MTRFTPWRLGLIFAASQERAAPQVWPAPLELRLFLGVGILGAVTTFSTFAMDTAYLVGQHRPVAVAVYVLASVALSPAGAFAGYHLAYAALA